MIAIGVATGRVAPVEWPPVEQTHAGRVEKSGRHRLDRAIAISPVPGAASEEGLPRRTRGFRRWKDAGICDRLHAGQRAQPIGHVGVVRRRVETVVPVRHRHEPGHDDTVGLKAEIDVRQPACAPAEQARAEYERERERHLPDRERPAPSSGRARGRSKRGGHTRGRGEHDRRHERHDRDERDRQRRRHRRDAPVGCHGERGIVDG